MTQNLQNVLRDVQLYSDDVIYRLVHLPKNAVVVAASVLAEIKEPFLVLIVDKDEVSLIVSEDDYQDYQHRLLGHRVADIHYRLITFDIPLDLSLVGFMASISTCLAQANISILPFAAYERDHVLVPSQSYSLAISSLQKLLSAN